MKNVAMYQTEDVSVLKGISINAMVIVDKSAVIRLHCLAKYEKDHP